VADNFVTQEMAERLWVARTEAEIVDLIAELPATTGGARWRPVGDRPNNIGTIRIASDPALAIIERITNAMDAVLEFGKLRHPLDEPTSPRQAATMWWEVPSTGLADMGEKDRRRLGELIAVSLDESGDNKRPTLVITDAGLGQTPSAFPKTLLSLNESNKVGQGYTMGTYGQGGSSTFGFSRATTVISRRHPDHAGGSADRVGFTIVCEKDDPSKQRLPNYEYLVGADGEVFTFDPAFVPELAHGTRIVHVAYDFQGWTGPYTTGAWQLFHAALFDPVLPFLVTGTRKKESGYGSRIVIGNAARLSNVGAAKGEIELAHSDSVAMDLGSEYGKVSFNYWVVRRPEGSDKSSDAAGGYVQPSSAVSMTLFGQRQDAEPRVWIKDRARLPFLYKNLIVQIDADGLTPIAKRELFASTRERATSSEIRIEIYDRLATTLLGDEELKRLNHEEKERLLQKSTSAANDKVRKKLQKFIDTKLKQQYKPGKGGSGTGPGATQKKKSGGPTTHRDTDDSALPHVPTRLLIRNKQMRIAQGSRTTVWVEIDAKNGYLPAHDDELELTWEGEEPGDKLRLYARSKLLGGLSKWFFEASVDAPRRDFTLTATLSTANGPLSDTTVITVVEPPSSPPNTSGVEQDTGPRVEWVAKDAWDEHGFDAATVGSVTVDDEETIIWVNRHFAALNQALSGFKLTPEAISLRADRYQFPVACGLWLQQFEMEKASAKPDEQYVKGEMRRLAEAVLAAIDPDVDAAVEESED
jgi:hypothetical protein